MWGYNFSLKVSKEFSFSRKSLDTSYCWVFFWPFLFVGMRNMSVSRSRHLWEVSAKTFLWHWFRPWCFILHVLAYGWGWLFQELRLSFGWWQPARFLQLIILEGRVSIQILFLTQDLCMEIARINYSFISSILILHGTVSFFWNVLVFFGRCLEGWGLSCLWNGALQAYSFCCHVVYMERNEQEDF